MGVVPRHAALAGAGALGLAAAAVGLLVVDEGGAFVIGVWEVGPGPIAATLWLGASVALLLAGLRVTRPPRESRESLDLRLAWIAIAVGGVAVAAVHLLPRWFDSVAREDWIVEWVSAAAALAACIWTWSAARREPVVVRLPLSLLSIAFFVMAGEEVSWLQRIVGYDTPAAIEGASSQGEANLHNLATDAVQSAFYVAASLLLVVAPYVTRWGPRQVEWLQPFAPGRVPLAIAVVSVAFTYARTGLAAHHLTFWIALVVLVLWDRGRPDRLTVALVVFLVVGHAVVVAGGADLERAWAPSEYRETLTALALAAWARELLIRSRVREPGASRRRNLHGGGTRRVGDPDSSRGPRSMRARTSPHVATEITGGNQ